MKLTILTDNNTFIDRYFTAEPGLSIFIEDEGKRILFDCGFSGVFFDNALRMGIDLLHLDALVFSHGHLDHTWGITRLIREYTRATIENRPCRRPRLISHPRTFVSTEVDGIGDIGPMLTPEKLALHFRLALSREPVKLSDRLIFLGEIPRRNNFEATIPIGRKSGETQGDFVPDDTALAYRKDDGLIIITGCSHAGICNIVEHARSVCGVDRIVDIIGGLHLLNPPRRQMEGTLRFISRLNLGRLFACHCTDLESKMSLAGVAPLFETGVGLCLEYD